MSDSDGKLVVAEGAVIRSLRGETITTRYNRRSFAVVQDFNKHDFRGDRRGAKWERDCEDNELRVRNRAVLLSRVVSSCRQMYAFQSKLTTYRARHMEARGNATSKVKEACPRTSRLGSENSWSHLHTSWKITRIFYTRQMVCPFLHHSLALN